LPPVLLTALDWLSILVGAAGAIILIGGVLAALGQIGRAWGWVMQQFRPAAPRVELDGAGGSYSQERDETTKKITWIGVSPSFIVRNNEPVSVYAVTAGVAEPGGEGRVAHPQRVPVLKAETAFTFERSDSLKIPSEWLADYVGADPHSGVPYFVELLDARQRRWEGIIDFRDEAPRLKFRRLRR
jgi:hypothetical protein